ncbi:MAG: zinc-binding dehydrogenase [Christensenellales bacterium]
MKALVAQRDGSVSIEEVPEPKINPYESLIEVKASAVCGTDMKILHDSLKGFSDYPTIIGHEAVGVVVKTGGKVRNLKKGDTVIMPLTPGKCGDYFSTWGAMAQYSVAGDYKAMADDKLPVDGEVFCDAHFAQNVIPASLDPVGATMIVTFREVYSTIKRLGFKKGQNIVIYGAGPVGLTFVKFAKLMGLNPVVCVDIDDEKTRNAKHIGADIVFNSTKTDAGAEIKRLFPDGADILLDAAGVPALINANLKLVRSFGQVCVYGVTPVNEHLINWQEAPYTFDLRFVQWPSKYEEAAVHDEIITMMLDGKLDGMDFISDVFDFADGVKAIDMFKARENQKKIVLKF